MTMTTTANDHHDDDGSMSSTAGDVQRRRPVEQLRVDVDLFVLQKLPHHARAIVDGGGVQRGKP